MTTKENGNQNIIRAGKEKNKEEKPEEEAHSTGSPQ